MNSNNTTELMLKRLSRCDERYIPIDLSYVGVDNSFLFCDYGIILSQHSYLRFKSRTKLSGGVFKNISWIKNALDNGVLVDCDNHRELYNLFTRNMDEKYKYISLKYYIYNNLRIYVDDVSEGRLVRTVVPFTLLKQNNIGCLSYKNRLIEILSGGDFTDDELNIMFSINDCKNIKSGREFVGDFVWGAGAVD